MRIGFAGLGRMGVPMARNLHKAGFDLTLFNRTARKARDLAGTLGCGFAATPVELAQHSDVVVTMLADDASSQELHLGPNGFFASGGGKTFLEMGTMSPDHIQALVAAAPENTTVIDAPVSGATQAATDAQLMIMAGCDEETADPVMPVLDALGREVICLGQTGAGAVMKLSVNSLLHGINQSFSEAMTLAEAAGIPTDLAFDAIEASAACAPMLKYRRPLYLDEAAHDVTFTIALAHKDMAVATALARASGVPMPQGEITRIRLEDAKNKGFGARDMAAILSYMREEQK